MSRISQNLEPYILNPKALNFKFRDLDPKTLKPQTYRLEQAKMKP